MKVRWGILLSAVVAVGVMLTGCSPQAVREAQRVVAEADSLRAEGVAYTDSVTMAEAYNTLDKWQYLYPTDYARACYYYGRLLRNNDDPVAAMQVFINATHTNTRDYHILARTYSNMGSICHLANEYQLAYDMYSRSADLFLKNGDTLLYYYLLNDMAIEQANQGKKEETLTILQTIQQHCLDTDIILRTYETSAELYKKTEEFDSALYWINYAKTYGNIDQFGIVIKAQVFDKLGMTDSALTCAKYVLEMPYVSEQAKYNMLYITSHYDSTISNDEILMQTSNRADVGIKLDNQHAKHAIAVQLLSQDLQRVPVWPWIVITMTFLCVTGGIICVSIYKKKRQHRLLSQQILYLQNTADMTQLERRKEIKRQCALFASSPTKSVDLCWKDYDAMCNVVNQHFLMLARKLQQEHLSEKEVRLCVLSLFNLGYVEMADMLCYAPNGIGKFKMRTAKKLGTTAKKMRDFLIEKAIYN